MKNIPKKYHSQVRKLIKEAVEEKNKRLGFFSEDIKNCFTPKCSCGKKATMQTERGKYAQERNHRPCNWGYYCNKCYEEGLEIEKEAMYG